MKFAIATGALLMLVGPALAHQQHQPPKPPAVPTHISNVNTNTNANNNTNNNYSNSESYSNSKSYSDSTSTAYGGNSTSNATGGNANSTAYGGAGGNATATGGAGGNGYGGAGGQGGQGGVGGIGEGGDATATSGDSSAVSGDSSASVGDVTVNNNSVAPGKVKITTKNVPDVLLSALTAGSNPCSGSATIGGSGVGFGIGLGKTMRDKNCEVRNTAVLLTGMGYTEAARQLLCQDERVRNAFAAAGQPCPVLSAPVVVAPPPPPPVAQVITPPPAAKPRVRRVAKVDCPPGAGPALPAPGKVAPGPTKAN